MKHYSNNNGVLIHRLGVLPLAIAMLAGPAPQVAFALEPSEPVDRALADVLVTGMRDARDRLRQGLVTVAGTEFQPALLGHEVRESAFQLSYAFDWDTEMVRCERECETQVATGVTAGGDLANPHWERWRYVYIRRPGLSIVFDTKVGETLGGQIRILAEDADLLGVEGFDVRAACLLLLTDYQSTRSVSFERIVTDWASDLRTQEVTAVADEGGGIWRIQWISKDGMAMRTIWLNRTQGFSVTRLELALGQRRKYADGHESVHWSSPMQVNTATWAELNGVWVPKTFRLEAPQFHDDAGQNKFYDHTFDWQSVNEPVSADLFEPESVGAPKGSKIINFQGQKGVIEGVVCDADSKLTGNVIPPARDDLPPTAQVQVANRRVVLFVIAAAAVIALIAMAIFRLWRRR